ncbi:MAG: hypothetical protein ABSH06_31310, partial [Thermodesulfobacteriota bacterium]
FNRSLRRFIKPVLRQRGSSLRLIFSYEIPSLPTLLKGGCRRPKPDYGAGRLGGIKNLTLKQRKEEFTRLLHKDAIELTEYYHERSVLQHFGHLF